MNDRKMQSVNTADALHFRAVFFESDAALLQVLARQHFLRLAFDAAARLVQFGVDS